MGSGHVSSGMNWISCSVEWVLRICWGIGLNLAVEAVPFILMMFEIAFSFCFIEESDGFGFLFFFFHGVYSSSLRFSINLSFSAIRLATPVFVAFSVSRNAFFSSKYLRSPHTDLCSGLPSLYLIFRICFYSGLRVRWFGISVLI